MRFENERVLIDPPKRPKKVTGTKLAGILGLDRWKTDFEVWCDLTRTYSEPFKDNKYTIAGKTIEPKIINYLRNVYMLDITTPEDVYGPDPFKKTWGNFFPNGGIFGGMWDGLLNENGNTFGVLEIKTSSRPQDWEYDVPENYAIQASLYAYLLGVDRVTFICSFLEDKDYENPEMFTPSAENTIIREFNVSERYRDFGKHIQLAIEWFDNHVKTGISPKYDKKKDEKILDALRTNIIEKPEDLEEILKELDELTIRLNSYKEEIKPDEKRLKELKDVVRKYAIDKFGKNDDKVVLQSNEFNWELSKSSREDIDKDRLKEDGLYEKYVVYKETFRLASKSKE